MKIKLTTTINDYHFAGEAITYVPDCYVELFEPVNEVDDDYEPLGIGDEPTEAYELKMVRKMREDAARILADGIAKVILEQMESGDTFNGYGK